MFNLIIDGVFFSFTLVSESFAGSMSHVPFYYMEFRGTYITQSFLLNLKQRSTIVIDDLNIFTKANKLINKLNKREKSVLLAANKMKYT